MKHNVKYLLGSVAILVVIVSAMLWNKQRNVGIPNDVEKGYFPVDLSERLQFRLAEFKPEEQWGVVPRGRQIFNGVEFQMDGYFEVKGVAPARHGLLPPMRVDGIPVNRYGSHIHLIHGTGFTIPNVRSSP